MIIFEPHEKNEPIPYCVVELSDGSEVYETHGTPFWRELIAFCKENGLSIKELTIVVGCTRKTIKKNNIKQYFIVREGRLTLDNVTVKKGYGIICLHPGNIKKTYIEWYKEDGDYAYREVLRGTRTFYEKEIGIPSA